MYEPVGAPALDELATPGCHPRWGAAVEPTSQRPKGGRGSRLSFGTKGATEPRGAGDTPLREGALAELGAGSPVVFLLARADGSSLHLRT